MSEEIHACLCVDPGKEQAAEKSPADIYTANGKSK
jgi:hypothetical protein